MSSYKGKAVNPVTGVIEEVDFLDDHYGRHKYGVQFPDGLVYPIDEVKVPEEPKSCTVDDTGECESCQ
jgi:hypothetical protein